MRHERWYGNGTGAEKRKPLVSREKVADNWDLAFGKKDKKSEEVEPDATNDNPEVAKDK